MSEVVEMRRWQVSQRWLNEARMAGLEANERRAALDRRPALVRAAMEAVEAYARLDGADEARRLCELAIARSGGTSRHGEV